MTGNVIFKRVLKAINIADDYKNVFGEKYQAYALCRDGVLVKWDIGLKKVISRLGTLPGENDAEAYRRITAMGGNIFLLSERTTFRPIKIEGGVQASGLRQEYLELMEEGCPDEKVYTGCLDGEKLYCHTDKDRYLCYDMKNERLE